MIRSGENGQTVFNGLRATLWQIKMTLAHWLVGRRCCAAGLADQQVSPTGLAFVPMLMETTIEHRDRKADQSISTEGYRGWKSSSLPRQFVFPERPCVNWVDWRTANL